MIINNSANKDNWTQLKNTIEPLSTCNVTACINAAQSCGYDVESLRKGLAQRPADDLLLFIRSDEQCNILWRQLDPNGQIPINQWMAPLALGFSKWLGPYDSAMFQMISWEAMRDNIIKGGACVVSGRYMTKKSAIDHITALVGIDYNDDLSVNNWIMDDSYGDYRTQYDVKVGDNILMPQKTMIATLKEQGYNSKRCIMVKKKESV